MKWRCAKGGGGGRRRGGSGWFVDQFTQQEDPLPLFLPSLYPSMRIYFTLAFFFEITTKYIIFQTIMY